MSRGGLKAGPGGTGVPTPASEPAVPIAVVNGAKVASG